MIEVLELSDKDYKVAITKLLQQITTNAHDPNEKEKVSAKKQKIQGKAKWKFQRGKTSNQNLELSSWTKQQNAEKRKISESEDRTIEIIRSEYQ